MKLVLLILGVLLLAVGGLWMGQGLGIIRWPEGNFMIAQSRNAGKVFRDCAECPEMVAIPSGKFTMGANDGASDEKPPHTVTLASPFAVGKFTITFAEWDACVAAGGCTEQPSDHGWGRGTRPVINVSWNDAHEYTAWVSKISGKPYRLLSEAEWEYAARAGTTTRYSWGDDIGRGNANCNGCGSQWAGKTDRAGRLVQTEPLRPARYAR